MPILIAVIAFTATGMLSCKKAPKGDPGGYDFIANLEDAEVWPPPAERKAPPRETLVFSEDFEGPDAGEWKVIPWKGNAEGERSAEVFRGGSHSFALWSATDPRTGKAEGADAEVSRIITVEGNTRYRFEGYVRTEGLVPLGAIVHGSFYLGEYRTPEELRGESVNPPRFHLEMEDFKGDTQGWMRVTFTFTTMEETILLKIAGSLGNWGRASGRVFIDDISLWKETPRGILRTVTEPEEGNFTVGKETRRSLAVPVPCTLTYRVEVRENTYLELAAGVPGGKSPSNILPVEFIVSAVDGHGAPQAIFQHSQLPGAGWHEQKVALSPFAGQTVDLRFETRCLHHPGTPSTGGQIAGGALWGHPVLRVPESPPGQTSLLLISIDTVRADHVGHLGYPRNTTPTLDRLASEGVSFRHGESASPWTLPSHASMLTATFLSYHGADDRTGLRREVPVAAEIFSEAGYFCGAITTHLYVSETFGFDRGFHTFRYEQEVPALIAVNEALTWLRRHGDRPTFLFLHLFDPHWDYKPPPPYDKMFDPEYDGPCRGGYFDSVLPYKDSKKAPAPRDLAHIIALYDGEIRYTDDQIGRLMEGLAELGLAKRTLTIITSDHGEEFQERGSMGHGSTLYEEQLHVPLVFHGACLGSAGLAVDAPVRTVDILPTALDILGLSAEKLPAGGGVSLAGLMEGRKGVKVPPAFAETRRWGAAKFSMRKGNDKVIRDRLTGMTSLFDLASDPGEKQNLFARFPERLHAFGKEMDVFFQTLSARAKKLKGEKPEDVVLTGEQKEILKALGYVH
jgi:arylsulfatase